MKQHLTGFHFYPGLTKWTLLALVLLSACQPDDSAQKNPPQAGQTDTQQPGQESPAGGSAVTGNGHVTTRTLDLPAFHSLDLHSGLQLIFHQDSHLSKAVVKLSLDENLFSQLEAKVSDGFLNVRLLAPVQASLKRIEITGPPLQGLILQGGSTATVDQFTGLPAYEIELRGGSQLKVEQLTGDQLKIGLHGGSRMTLRGKVGQLATDTLAGGSYADLQDLKTTDAQLHLQGGSEARVDVSHKLDVDMAGGSKVYYAGTAQVQEHTMAGGSRVMALLK